MIKLWKPDENSRNVEEITILSEKREDILNQLNPIQYYKMEHHKIIIKQFNCVKVCVKEMDSSWWFTGKQFSINKNIRFKTHMLRLGWCDYSDAILL